MPPVVRMVNMHHTCGSFTSSIFVKSPAFLQRREYSATRALANWWDEKVDGIAGGMVECGSKGGVLQIL
jgi:hypothetical protein